MEREKKKRTTGIVEVEEPPFGTPYVLALAVVAGPDRHAIHRIAKPETRVGRSLEVDFRLNDPTISDEHFAVRVNAGHFTLVDLESTNGTVLNHLQISKGARVRLKNFDEIQAGRTRFLFIANLFRAEFPPTSMPR
jgi:pSer/pThr/pTyr-binding forkhead associated (FHA) protein